MCQMNVRVAKYQKTKILSIHIYRWSNKKKILVLVRRSHPSKYSRFYSYLKFYNLEDLREQRKRYLKRLNNIPMAVLGYLTPKEKRSELEVFGMINYAI